MNIKHIAIIGSLLYTINTISMDCALKENRMSQSLERNRHRTSTDLRTAFMRQNACIDACSIINDLNGKKFERFKTFFDDNGPILGVKEIMTIINSIREKNKNPEYLVFATAYMQINSLLLNTRVMTKDYYKHKPTSYKS